MPAAEAAAAHFRHFFAFDGAIAAFSHFAI
jgi:type VI protein secretion system component VasK